MAFFVCSMALELGKSGIRVNSISPGLFPTEMSAGFVDSVTEFFSKEHPLGRVGNTGKDLDGPLLLLASEAGAYITGANLTVDGGLGLLNKPFF